MLPWPVVTQGEAWFAGSLHKAGKTSAGLACTFASSEDLALDAVGRAFLRPADALALVNEG